MPMWARVYVAVHEAQEHNCACISTCVHSCVGVYVTTLGAQACMGECVGTCKKLAGAQCACMCVYMCMFVRAGARTRMLAGAYVAASMSARAHKRRAWVPMCIPTWMLMSPRSGARACVGVRVGACTLK